MSSDMRSRRLMASRFRGFLPVVVDVETGGFDPATNALLEIAAVAVMSDERGEWRREKTVSCHVQAFPGAHLNQASLKFTGIDPHHPFRFAVPEHEALESIFEFVRQGVAKTGCTRAILVGHNPSFDLAFIKAAVARTGIKRNPFHSFSTFDTATLGGLAVGQTVLSRAVQAAGLDWDDAEAHTAIYDAERTADLFCAVLNKWNELAGG
ncbi:MAG: ribonuclease T [Gammaproteobacteria bacterium]